MRFADAAKMIRSQRTPLNDAMTDVDTSIPPVLILSGLDPSGGAGIQADIETIGSMGCHACAVITAQTVQDSHAVKRFVRADPMLMIEQARAVLEDFNIRAIKIGMVGHHAIIEAIHSILVDYPDIPVVFDPVLRASGGGALIDAEALEALRTLLLPQTSVLTPNRREAQQLAPNADNIDACAEQLQDEGCEYVLVTGGDEHSEQVHNRLYSQHRLLEDFSWERLPHQYHGSGCTLASSIAGLLAQGSEPFNAIHEAQSYTWECLRQAYRLSDGQWLPNRLFWARTES
jgi:hydroxymethylpyrimidine/phosphomethylpyrimidine kinase